MTKRKLDGVISKALWLYVLLMGIFHLYTAIFGAFEAYLQRAIHLTWVLPMVYVVYPMFESKDKKPKTSVAWYDWILAIVSTIPGFYIMFNYNEIVERMAGVDEVTMIQLVLGTIIILTLIEATRRAVGFPIILVSLAFMSYCMYYQMTDIATQNGLASISENFWLCFKEAYKHSQKFSEIEVRPFCVAMSVIW